MTDRIILANLVFQARHGVEPRERAHAQRFEVDVELALDLGPAGRADDLGLTVDYALVYRSVRRVVETTTYALLEALAEAIVREVLAEQPQVTEIVVRVRKPQVRLGGLLDYAGVEIRRTRRP